MKSRLFWQPAHDYHLKEKISKIQREMVKKYQYRFLHCLRIQSCKHTFDHLPYHQQEDSDLCKLHLGCKEFCDMRRFLQSKNTVLDGVLGTGKVCFPPKNC